MSEAFDRMIGVAERRISEGADIFWNPLIDVMFGVALQRHWPSVAEELNQMMQKNDEDAGDAYQDDEFITELESLLGKREVEV